ncbi:hypothetical protein F4604DRAFT_1690822 [Suillus subluteus]|nr:hypothetical protein F4604DRAFT_1690822 [Suillus subluteus]
MARSQSPIVVLQQNKVPLDKAEVTVLRAHLEDWKSVKGKERARVLIAIHKEASLQALTKDKAILKVRKKLSAEEKEEAQAMADKWNNEAAPPEVQAHVAETKGADMIEHFTTEMFKKAGMRIFVLSAWKDGKGKLMLGGHDFNEQFANGESFIKTRDWVAYSTGHKGMETRRSTPHDPILLDNTLYVRTGMCGSKDNIKASAWKDADGEMHVAAVSPSGTWWSAGDDHQDAQCSNSEEHDDGGLSGAIDQGAQSAGEEEEISLGRQYTPTPRTNFNSAEVGNPMKAKGETSCRNVSNTLADIGNAVNVAILNGSGNARQPDQSQKTMKEAVAAGTRTRSKAAANISNERPKRLKRRAADPVCDTPAKRTRSKATALAASKKFWLLVIPRMYSLC